MRDWEYKAFISYSHADDRAAAWLQRALESFRIPGKLVRSSKGAVPARIGKIFRDREELAAGENLSQFINEALEQSEFLIVICSPEARRSRWVSLEIEKFRQERDHSNILCLIVDGEPFADKAGTDADRECFPAALGYGVGSGAEPIAADLRPGRDGKRLARLKIAAGLLGVKLDELVQRDTQRRIRNLTITAVASALGMLAFALVSYVAVDAREGEQQRRAEAEDLIEFMLSDLRDRLDEVGRLDVLDAVGDKAIEYYSNTPLSEYGESALGRRARAFHLLGEVRDLQGDLETAREAFSEALRSTGELLERDRDNAERIYEHAQSVFWLGYLDWRLGDLASTETYFRQYLDLAEDLVAAEGNNSTWRTELGNAHLNLGVYYEEQADYAQAEAYFGQARDIYHDLHEHEPENADIAWQLAQSYAYLADASRGVGDAQGALKHRAIELDLYEAMQRQNPSDQDINLSLLTAHQAVARLLQEVGDEAGAIESFRRAGDIGAALRALDPKNTLVAFELGGNHLSLSRSLLAVGRAESARAYLAQAEAIAMELLDRNPDVEEWQRLHEATRAFREQLDVSAGASAQEHAAEGKPEQ